MLTAQTPDEANKGWRTTLGKGADAIDHRHALVPSEGCYGLFTHLSQIVWYNSLAAFVLAIRYAWLKRWLMDSKDRRDGPNKPTGGDA